MRQRVTQDAAAGHAAVIAINGNSGENGHVWLAGDGMDSAAAPIDKLPMIPGIPFMHEGGCSATIVGETGGGRSMLIQACLYDAGKAGLRCAYLGSEVTMDEFNARAAVLAQTRGHDPKDDGLRAELDRVRYLDVYSTIAQAWNQPSAWINGVSAMYDVLVIDPLSSVASALGHDYEKTGTQYVAMYDRLIKPLTDRGVAVVLLDNVGHGEDARHRGRGTSSKGDRADLTFVVKRQAAASALVLRAEKVRSIRADIQKGDEWVITKADQVLIRQGSQPAIEEGKAAPTFAMELASRAIEADDGITRNAIVDAVKGRAKVRKETVTLAVGWLIDNGYVMSSKDGQAHRHTSLRSYRQGDHLAGDQRTGSGGSQPGPHRVPDPVQTPGPDEGHTSRRDVPLGDPVSPGPGPASTGSRILEGRDGQRGGVDRHPSEPIAIATPTTGNEVTSGLHGWSVAELESVAASFEELA